MASASGGAGITIGLYDGYTDCRHPDLSPRCSSTLISGGSYSRRDDHGTHTAGIIAGSKYGVATGATIANYAVFDDRGYVATGSKLIDSWNGAAARGATIASMSFGCSGLALCFSPAEVRAMASAGLSSTLFVKAAGNDGDYLANEGIDVTAAEAQTALSRLILVGSVDASGARSAFSNMPGEGCLVPSGVTSCSSATQWKYHFLVAPGENIYSTLPNGAYGYMSGTSMATPIVAGAAALLEARWPHLKSQPTSVANILYNSATDLGAPGLDPVYGWGLLNVARAFRNSGATTIVTPAGASLPVDGRTLITSNTMGALAPVLAGVTAFDEYGRDYKLAEVSNFHVRRNLLAEWGPRVQRLALLERNADWTESFFAPTKTQRTWAAFGPLQSPLANSLAFDRSLRLGFEMPLSGGSIQLRLTGQTNARGDFANDDALRPMSFFASSELLNQSALVGLSHRLSNTSRLVAFGAVSVGQQITPDYGQPFRRPYEFDSSPPDYAFQMDRTPRHQVAFGVGYWKQMDEHTVVGLTASAFLQRGAYYDLASNLDAFRPTTQVYNLGIAANRRHGRWDLFGAFELSMVKTASGAGPVQLGNAVLGSGELGIRRSNLLFDGKRIKDALSFSLVAPPQALSGGLRLNYLDRTADGLGLQAVDRRVPLADITGRSLRLETGYTVRRRDNWSFAILGGVDLARTDDYLVTSEVSWAF